MSTVSLKINSTAVDNYVLKAEIPQKSRERDYSPIARGFEIVLKENISPAPAKNDIVELFVDGDEHFLGWIKDVKIDYSSGGDYVCEVNNYLLKLDEKLVEYDNIHYLIGDTGDFTGAPTFTVDTTNDYLTDTGHSLNNGDRIVVQSTGTLPDPLKAGHYYWVVKIDANNVRLYEDYYEYITAGTYVDITDAGTGTHSYTTNIDLDKYNDVRPTGGPSRWPSVSIKWLITKLFEDCGMTLSSTAIDSQVLYSATISSVSYTFNWSELLLDENMLYALNQGVAAIHTLFDDTAADISYFRNKITYWELIRFIFSCFGFSIRYTGDSSTKTFTLAGQSRNVSTGAPTPGSETLYSISDNNKWQYESEVILGSQGGYSYSGKWSYRSDYIDAALDQLTEYQITRVNAGEDTVSVFNNFLILLRNKSAGAPSGDVFAETEYFLFGNMLYNKVSALIFNFQREEITAKDIQLTNHTITEEIVDVANKASIIVQEDNLLTSG